MGRATPPPPRTTGRAARRLASHTFAAASPRDATGENSAPTSTTLYALSASAASASLRSVSSSACPRSGQPAPLAVPGVIK
jgi:hypothetical protein